MTNEIVILKEKWDKLETKKNLQGEDAKLAIQENGYALRYVPETYWDKQI